MAPDADVPPKQDMPPPGGYKKFNWERTFAKAVWRPKTILGVLAGTMLYGTYQKDSNLRHRMTLKFEDIDINNALEPFHTAERDRFWLKLLKKNRDIENEVMKDVPGWVTGTWYGEPVFYTLGDKWWDPDPVELFIHSSTDRMEHDITWRHWSTYARPHWWDKYMPKWVQEYVP